MAEQQLPQLEDLIAAGAGALCARRPNARQHLAAGRYGAILAGWRGQASLCRTRLAHEVNATRLPLAQGAALWQLAESEFWAVLPDSPRQATGEVVLSRTKTDTSATVEPGLFRTGTIPSGTVVARPAAPSAQPARQAARYATTEPAYIDGDETEPVRRVVPSSPQQYTHEQRIGIPIRALQSGPAANTPDYVGGDGHELDGSLVSTLFDPSLTVLSLRASGGQAKVGDDQIRNMALVAHAGVAGPTDAAILMGAFAHGGVWRAVYVDDPDDGIGKLYVADQSWACSDAMGAEVESVLVGQAPAGGAAARRWLGFGASAECRGVKTQIVTVRATLVLRSPQFTAQGAEIIAKVRADLTGYFDDRPDWYTWTLGALGGLLASSDSRISACSSVVVLDATGAPLAEPPANVTPATHPYLTHFALVDQSVRLTCLGPS